MSKSRDIADSAATINFIDGLTSNVQEQLDASAVEVGETLPDPVPTAGTLFFLSGANNLYVSNGISWVYSANQGPTPTGGTVVIPSVSELSGSFSYNLGIDFNDDLDEDSALIYTLESGTLPTGCVLPTTGNTTLTGTIPAASSDTLFSFQIKATDSAGASRTQNYQWTITNVVPTATGGTVSIPETYGTESASYDVDANFTFGTGSTFSSYALQSGTLPAGLSLDSATGVISGTADAIFTTYTFTIRGTDTNGDTVDQAYSWPIIQRPPVVASGGTKTTDGLYTVHTFTSSGTLTISGGGTVEALLVGGGGAGGNYGSNNVGAGGGGAGGVVTGSYTLSVGSYSIVVGAGGAGSASQSNGSNGSDTVAFSYVAKGGGGGGENGQRGQDGGSGGGGARAPGGLSLAGNIGNSGGTSGSQYTAGGGGGASAAGSDDSGSSTNTKSGAGGDGATYLGRLVAGGGGGGTSTAGGNTGTALGGSGGGGNGSGSAGYANSGQSNTGGGGGGAGAVTVSGSGGSGIVVVRYLT